LLDVTGTRRPSDASESFTLFGYSVEIAPLASTRPPSTRLAAAPDTACA
jgi:hypothetical protein